MSDPIYIIRLGGNLYIDDRGVVHDGPSPPVPSYDMPGGVLATLNEASKLAKTMKDIGGAMPNEDDKKAFQELAEKLSKLGIPGEDVAKLLAVVGKAANTIGNIFIAAGVVVAAAKILGIFKEGPSPLEVLVNERFDRLERDNRALQTVSREQKLQEHLNALNSATSTVAGFVGQRDSGAMTNIEIETRLQTLTTALSLLAVSDILGLVTTSTYIALFDQSQYMKAWPFFGGRLFCVPAGIPPQQAIEPEINAPVFDHRLAVVLAPQAAQSFLAQISALSPEFRTLGDFRPTIRDFARAVSEVAESMRNKTLAKSIYTETEFGFTIADFFVNDPLPGITEPSLNADFSIPVGALDLCSHNDAFFPDVRAGFGPPFPGPSRRGSIDFRWRPPALLKRDVFPSGLVHSDGRPIVNYRITNPKDCANAANEVSMQDYADILLSSGYLTLTQLAAQLRHAATEPSKSETVHGETWAFRQPQPGSAVTVISAPGPIVFTKTGEISAQAWREPQKVHAVVSCSTQALARTKHIKYRVLLRTLRSAAPPRGWTEPNYDYVQAADYIDDPLNPGFKRLRLVTSAVPVKKSDLSPILDEVELAVGITQVEDRHVIRDVELKAHTFDWWAPVNFHSGLGDATAHLGEHPHVFASNTDRPPIGKAKPRPGPALSDRLPRDSIVEPSTILGLGWTDGAQVPEAFHREMLETTIGLRVKLDWQEDKLRVEVANWVDDRENRFDHRNYVVFLVVEETFGFIEPDEMPPKVLHTAFPIAINGQITYVPQSLFDDEADAQSKQRAFAERFAKSVSPRPGAPILGATSIGPLATDSGVAQLAAKLRQVDPEGFSELTRTPEDQAVWIAK